MLFTFYIQGVLKLKKNNSGAKSSRLLEENVGKYDWGGVQHLMGDVEGVERWDFVMFMLKIMFM